MNELSVINVQNIFSKVKKVLFWNPCFFLLYINDLPKIINNKSIHILFADDTSILFTNSNLTNYNKDIYTVFKFVNKCFKGNFLSLNFEKTHYIHVTTKNNLTINMKICCDNNLIPSVLHPKFLGINIVSTLYWRMHIEQLISKLSSAFYIIRPIKPYMSHTLFITIYYSHFHYIMNYGLIFWGNSCSCKIIMLKGGIQNYYGVQE
jgi:hypothetical protein